MDIPAASWHRAIFERRSRRTYLQRPVEDEKLERLRAVCLHFHPFSGARAELVLRPPERVFKGVAGRYGRVNGALHYVAFIGDMTEPRVQEAVGFAGEGIVLEAQAMGLDTCWVGGFFRPDSVRRDLSLSENERVLSVTPVGYAIPAEDFSERLLESLARSRRRKPLADLVREGDAAGWIREALQAARLAPSARNRQPWRFRIRHGSVIVEEDGKPSFSAISKRLDCGIAMLHLEVGAAAAGVRGGWEFLESPQIAKFTPDLS